MFWLKKTTIKTSRWTEKTTQQNFYTKKLLATKVIMDCRTATAHEFRTSLELKKNSCHLKQQPISIDENKNFI